MCPHGHPYIPEHSPEDMVCTTLFNPFQGSRMFDALGPISMVSLLYGNYSAKPANAVLSSMPPTHILRRIPVGRKSLSGEHGPGIGILCQCRLSFCDR